MKWIKNNRITLFLLVFCLVFFSIYSYFNLMVINPDYISASSNLVKFNSPDETANYYWINKFASGEPLYYFESLNNVGTNLIHPRAINTINGKVTPGSFLGLILIYGILVKLFTLYIIPFLTPFFATLALFFFYLLIKLVFKHRPIALISTILLSFFPAWLYYAARGMYHNILFISLLIIALYLLLYVLINNKKSFSLYFLSAFLTGLAILTRTSEIIWVTLLIFSILLINFKKIYWPGFIVFLSGALIPLFILFYYNQILYGSFISAGYKAIVPTGGVGEAIRSGIFFQILISPFGFNFKTILYNTYNYLYKLLPFWSIPTILGGLLFISLPTKIIKISYKIRYIYLAYFIVITTYLLIFYGSWQFSDRIDETSLSLGTSYLRYWLPIYIFAIPLLATLFWQFTKLLIPSQFRLKEISRILIVAGLVIIIFMPTINLVYRQTDESLFLLKNLSATRLKAKLIKSTVSPDDIIVIYKQADKIFFPDYTRLITELVVPGDYLALTKLIKLQNIYYYTFANPQTVKYISLKKFEPLGLQLVDGKRVLGQDWIYKIIVK